MLYLIQRAQFQVKENPANPAGRGIIGAVFSPVGFAETGEIKQSVECRAALTFSVPSRPCLAGRLPLASRSARRPIWHPPISSLGGKLDNFRYGNHNASPSLQEFAVSPLSSRGNNGVSLERSVFRDGPYLYSTVARGESIKRRDGQKICCCFDFGVRRSLDEVTVGLFGPRGVAISGGRYVVDGFIDKIISYPVGVADGSLGAPRDEITILNAPVAIAISGGGRMWRTIAKIEMKSAAREEEATGLKAISRLEGNKIISYAMGAKEGRLFNPRAIAFLRSGLCGGQNRLLAVEAGGVLGAGRDEITAGLIKPEAIAFSGGRAYVTDRDLDKPRHLLCGGGGRKYGARDEVTKI